MSIWIPTCNFRSPVARTSARRGARRASFRRTSVWACDSERGCPERKHWTLAAIQPHSACWDFRKFTVHSSPFRVHSSPFRVHSSHLRAHSSHSCSCSHLSFRFRSLVGHWLPEDKRCSHTDTVSRHKIEKLSKSTVFQSCTNLEQSFTIRLGCCPFTN